MILQHLCSKHVFFIFSIPILVEYFYFGHVQFEISESRIISIKKCVYLDAPTYHFNYLSKLNLDVVSILM